jgi:DNA-directed RNA polymerase subunit RPC12/RpoP
MADMKFTCTHCGQEIECDELWSGHEIQCPTCQKQLVVPPKPDAPPHAALAAARPGQPRLSIGQSQIGRSAAPKAIAPQVAALEQKLSQVRSGQKSGAMKWVTIGAVVVVCGVGGYLGYPYVSEALAKRSEAAKKASNTATQEVAAATAPDAPPAAPETPAPEKELPVLSPVWTLDVDKAKIPDGKVNGSISGTNFVADSAMCTAQLVRFFQGASASPDREIIVYLHLNPGQSPTGHTWSVSQDMKGRTVPQVVKRWKVNPKYAPQSKQFASGYAMKLEFGEVTNGIIPGKVFVALPDTEQTVIAGQFKASTTLADASGAAAPPPTVTPNPTAPPPGPSPADRSAFDRRYGVKR